MRLAFVIAVAVLLGLVFFLIREVRRPPGPMQWGRTPRWGKRLRVTLDALILLLGLLLFWAFFIEPNRLVVRDKLSKLRTGRESSTVSALPCFQTFTSVHL